MSVRHFFIDLTDPVVFQSFGGEAFWKKIEVGPGSVILSEGEESRDFYYIFSGRVSVEKSLQDLHNTQKYLATLADGEFFGEGALLSDKMRSASVKALTPCVLLQLSQAKFEALVLKDPSVAMAIVLGIVKVLNARLQAANEEMVVLHQVCKVVKNAHGNPLDVSKPFLEIEEKALHHQKLVFLKPNGDLRWKGAAVSAEELARFKDGVVHLKNVFAVMGATSYVDAQILYLPVRSVSGEWVAVLVAPICASCTETDLKGLRVLAQELGCLE